MTRESSQAGISQTWLDIMGPTQRKLVLPLRPPSEQLCGSDRSAPTWAASLQPVCQSWFPFRQKPCHAMVLCIRILKDLLSFQNEL